MHYGIIKIKICLVLFYFDANVKINTKKTTNKNKISDHMTKKWQTVASLITATLLKRTEWDEIFC